MKHFFSLSQYPGKTGEHYYNTLFRKKNLPYTYTALACNDIAEGVKKMRDIGAAGFSVSMPFKHSVIKHLDFAYNNVYHYDSCNTVQNVNGKFYGFNCDIIGVEYIISLIPISARICILGDGTIGSMFKRVLNDRAEVYSRKLGNWDKRHQSSDVIINCTSFGTAVTDSPFYVLPLKTTLVIDLAIKQNQLQGQATDAGVKYISGIEFYKQQLRSQFYIYTGSSELTMEEINQI
jgi:shikimate dehydrogenase